MVKWSAWHKNPFAAIREVATDDDYQKALAELSRIAQWPDVTTLYVVDELLAEIAGATNIVCQYQETGITQEYRAAYDE